MTRNGGEGELGLLGGCVVAMQGRDAGGSVGEAQVQDWCVRTRQFRLLVGEGGARRRQLGLQSG